MAYYRIDEYSRHGITFAIHELQYDADLYDWFIFKVHYNGRTIIERRVANESYMVGKKGFYYMLGDLLDDTYLVFSPDCLYTASVSCSWNGVVYNLTNADTGYNDFDFETEGIDYFGSLDDITPIGESYLPVTDQKGVGSCVAHALAYIMSVFTYRKTERCERYSISYIHGSDGRSDDSMYIEDALNNCIDFGSPRSEIYLGVVDRSVCGSGPVSDNESKRNAVSRFKAVQQSSKYGGRLIRENAKKQCFGGWEKIDFYDCQAVHECIQKYGVCLLGLTTSNNFKYEMNGKSYVPQPDPTGLGLHAIALIGAEKRGGKLYWIAQNSWGEGWGSNGRCYIPYDWGCGSHPNGSSDVYTSSQTGGTSSSNTTTWRKPWVLACYKIYPNETEYPTQKTLPSVVNFRLEQDQYNRWLTQIIFDCDDSHCAYFLLARNQSQKYNFSVVLYEKRVGEKEKTIEVDLSNYCRNSYDNMEILIIATNDEFFCSDPSAMHTVFVKVPQWQWNMSNSLDDSSNPSTDAETNDAKNAVYLQGKVKNFSHKVWNDLVDKVYCLIGTTDSARGWLTKDTLLEDGDPRKPLLSYEDTKMSSSDKVLTAKRFNSLRYNIGTRYSTGITSVYGKSCPDENGEGSPVLGQYFITLVDRINEWADNGLPG